MPPLKNSIEPTAWPRGACCPCRLEARQLSYLQMAQGWPKRHAACQNPASTSDKHMYGLLVLVYGQRDQARMQACSDVTLAGSPYLFFAGSPLQPVKPTCIAPTPGFAEHLARGASLQRSGPSFRSGTLIPYRSFEAHAKEPAFGKQHKAQMKQQMGLLQMHFCWMHPRHHSTYTLRGRVGLAAMSWMCNPLQHNTSAFLTDYSQTFLGSRSDKLTTATATSSPTQTPPGSTKPMTPSRCCRLFPRLLYPKAPEAPHKAH